MACFSFADEPEIEYRFDEEMPFEPIIEFYRSEKSAKGKFGLADSGYKGEFGFDWYDPDVDGEGYTAKEAFEELNIVNRKYLAPWLVLWPPKSLVLNKYRDIDPSFTPVNKASITLKIIEGITDGEEIGNITLKASTPNITINGSQNTELTAIEIGKKTSVDIELTNELSNDEYIEVYTTDTNKLIGKLNVLKNDKIKVVKPTMFEVKVGTTASNAITSSTVPSSYLSGFNYLQENSLNQALTYIKPPTICNNFTVDKANLKGYHEREDQSPVYIDYTKDNQQYFLKTLIENWYQLKTGNSISAVDKAIGELPDLTPMRSIGYKMIKNIQKSFEEHKGKPNRLALTLSENQKHIDKYEEKRSKYPETLPEPGKPKMAINPEARAFWQSEASKEDLLLFTIPDIEYLRSAANAGGSFDNNPGWSVKEKNTIVGFNALFKDGGTVAHEFGHAFGLEHTFTTSDNNAKKKEEDVVEENLFYEEINKKIRVIDMFFTNDGIYAKNWMKYEGQKQALNIMQYNIADIEDLRTKEKELAIGSIKSSKASSMATTNIDDLKLETAQTKENFMDYLDPDSNRKTFSIKQIKSIINN